MPCKIDSHTHEWKRNGVLSIAKCETTCNFCSSGKEYKPASALRKHVLTHIKNEGLSLTLEHSVSGRPKKRERSPLAASPSENATSSRSVTESPAGAAILTDTAIGPSTPSELRLSGACWRCIIFGLECSGRRDNSSCSQCLGDDPQPFCSSKALSMFHSLVFTDDFDFLVDLHWQDSRNGLLRVGFVDRDPDIPGASEDLIHLPSEHHPVTTLMDVSLPCLTINGHILKERNIIFRRIIAAAESYSTVFVTKSIISQGLKLLAFTLRTFIAIYYLSRRWAPNLISTAPAEKRQRDGLIICGLIPDIKTELQDFLSSLHEQIFSPKLLKAISSEQPDIVAVEHAADVLQIFYGTLILFITRASLKAIFSCSFGGDFHPSARQAMQDPTFDRGWNCPLYQPMLYTLGCSEISFERVLRVLDPRSDTYGHYEAAAHLFPVRLEAFMIEHIAYFFEQFFPSSHNENERLVMAHEDISAQLAQLAALPMG